MRRDLGEGIRRILCLENRREALCNKEMEGGDDGDTVCGVRMMQVHGIRRRIHTRTLR
jgi:hypothetical protein